MRIVLNDVPVEEADRLSGRRRRETDQKAVEVSGPLGEPLSVKINLGA